MTSFQSSPYSSNYSNFPASPFPSSSSSPVRFDRPLYIEETASSPAYIESLETAELALVQHLKTAGLRKQRELALIDEVMKIRTERKKIFSALNKVLSRQKAECTRVVSLLESEKTDWEGIIADKDKEIAMLKSSLAEEVQEIQSKAELQKNLEIRGLTEKYESQLRTLEATVSEVVSQDKSSKEGEIQKAAKNLLESKKEEMEQEFRENVFKYKEALRKVTEREKDLLKNKETLEEDVNKLLREKKKHLQKMTEIEKHMNTMKSKIKMEADRSLEFEEKCVRLEGVIEKNRLQHQREMALREQENQTHHQNTLDSIDEKVRKALALKDEKINALVRQLTESERKRQETEDMIRGMQEELGI